MKKREEGKKEGKKEIETMITKQELKEKENQLLEMAGTFCSQ